MNLMLKQWINQACARIDIKNQGMYGNDVSIGVMEGEVYITQPQWFSGGDRLCFRNI